MTRPVNKIKAALLQVHSIAGLILALLLALIALTGAVMSFEDEIVEHLNVEIMQVAPQQAPALMPDELVARLEAGQNFGTVTAIMLSSDPSAAIRVRFGRDEHGALRTSLYVDPYDGRVLGPARGEEFFATVRRLHRWLLIPGDAKGGGRQVTGIAALGLIVMLVSGLVLRWPRRASSLKMWLKPDLGLSGRGLHRSLHAVIGTWVLPIYLVMALTGLWYAFDWYKSSAVWLLARSDKAATAPKPAHLAQGAQGHLDTKAEPIRLDRAWEAFQQAQGDRFAKAQLMLSQGTATIVRIRSWPAGAADGARDEFRIDAATGHIVSAELYTDKTTGERILARVLDIHRGSIFGWPGKLLFMLAAGLMPLFVVTGFLLYLSRRRHRRMMQRAPLPRLVPGE